MVSTRGVSTVARVLRGSMSAFAVLLAFLFVPFFLSAGGQAEVEEADPDVSDERQAPALAALVRSGDLPPLEERLPENPKVVVPHEEVGRYGGEIRSALIGAADGAWFTRTIAYDGLVVFNREWSDVEPGLAADIDINEDATAYTFELRRGLRWSDGEPFTTADVEWWYDHVASHEGISPVFPSTFAAAGEPAELEVIDEVTFRFVFAETNPLFLDELAATTPWIPTPMHYAQQFHEDFNEDVHDLADAEGFDDWLEYYDYYVSDGAWTNPDLPSMRAFTPVEGAGYTGDVTVVRMERNPYFYRVDTDGNQLPYADSWAFDMVEDSEVLLLRTMAGEIDVMHRHINNVENRPVLHDGRDAGDYRLINFETAHQNISVLQLNMTHDDEVVREINRNRDFRIGLSHAIDREEISEILFAGLAEPRQPAPHSAMPWYHERLEQQYLEYDVDLANEYFDRAGFELDDRGRRLGPDGEPISITFETSRETGIDILELVQQQVAEVGINIEVQYRDRTLYYERKESNLHEAAEWNGPGGMRDGLLDPRNYIPFSHESNIAPRWAAWYGNPGILGAGVEPEEPPEGVRRGFELYDKLLSSPPAEHADIMYELLDNAADEFWFIGTVGHVGDYGIFHNRIGNAPPEGTPHAWQYPSPGPADLSQLFVRE